MIKYAVHHVFDTLDDNEHYYFSSYADALELFNQIKSQIETTTTVYDREKLQELIAK
jgi:hypothetical protein